MSADSTIPARCKTTGASLPDGAPRMSVHPGSRGRRVMAAAFVLVLGAAACAGEGEGRPPAATGRQPEASASAGDVATPTPAGDLTVRLAYVGDYALEEAPALVAPGYQGASLAAEQATEAGGLPADVEVVSYSTDGDTEKALEVAGELAADPQVVGVLIAPVHRRVAGRRRGAPGGRPAADQPVVARSLVRAQWVVGLAAGRGRSRAPRPGPSRRSPARCRRPERGSAWPGTEAGWRRRSGGPPGASWRGSSAARITVPPGDASAARAAASVRRAGCGVVLWTGYGARAAALRLRLSTSGRPVQMLATDAAKTESYLTETGREGDGTVVSCGCVDLTTSTRLDAQRFINAFQFDIGALPGPYAVEGWDAGNRFIEAVRRGAITRGEVATALEGDRSYDGLAGTYAFRGDGELEASAAAIRFYRAEGGRWIGLGSDDGTEPFGVRSEGTLTVGSCRWGRPFAFRRGGRLRGFDVDVAGDLAARLGLRLGWRRIACGNQDRALASGRIDVLAGVQRPGPRAGEDSRIYLSLRQALVVRHGSGIHGADDLGPRDVVAVVRGSAGDRWARRELAPGGTAIERLTRLESSLRPPAPRPRRCGARRRVAGALRGRRRDRRLDGRRGRLSRLRRVEGGSGACSPRSTARSRRSCSSRAYRRTFARWFPGSTCLRRRDPRRGLRLPTQPAISRRRDPRTPYGVGRPTRRWAAV